MNETLKETGKSVSDVQVRLLTYVLNSDDLLARTSQTFRLEAARVVVKRGEGQPGAWSTAPEEIFVNDGHASRSHVTLEKRGASTVALDGGSRNGTFLNGQRIDREATLVDGDMLQVGHSLWCYREVSKGILRGLDASAQMGVNRSYCPEVAELYRLLALLAPSREPVLIIAETGSGKELVARAVHRLSGRSGQFVAIDCGAVPESLFESTFFGHERGAYTGATEARTGEVVRASTGTLFLDEVGNLAGPSQAKLLRVLEAAQVSPLGSRAPVNVDVRWVAATNAQLFDDTGFRSDLVHRLAGFVARLPPLRRRREDLGVLTAQFLEEMGITQASMSPEAATLVFNHPFPGNVRQLRAALRSAALLAQGDSGAKGLELNATHFPELKRGSASQGPQEDAGPGDAPAARKRPPTADEVSKALEKTGGNVSQAAKLLNTYPRQLYRWLEQMPEVLEKFRTDG